MRIISGAFKGRKFNPPKKKLSTRPTTDFARENLFNILRNNIDFQDCRFLDLFGGFGMISLEAVSLGCNKVVYVEQNRICSQFVMQCSQTLKVEERLDIKNMDVFKYISQYVHQESFDIVFADPPYAHPKMNKMPEIVRRSLLLKTGGLFILEHNNNNNFTDHIGFEDQRTYGQSIFSFFRN